MSSDLAVLLAGLLAGLVTGLLGPRVIARLPEPELDAKPPEGEDNGSRLTIAPAYSKVTYAELAARPRLGLLFAAGGAAAGLLLGYALGWSEDLLVVLPLVPLGVWLAYVDWRTTFLPTRIIAPGYLLVVAAIVAISISSEDWDSALRAVEGWAVYGGLFFLMWRLTPGFGYGDVRLAGLLGLALGWLGWPELLLGFLGGLFVGSVGGGLLALLKVIDPRRNPFGPYMLVAAGIAAAYGPEIADRLGY